MNWSGWGKRPLKLEVQFYLGGCIQVWEKMGMFPTHSTGFIRHLALLLISFTLVTTSPTLLLPLHVQNSPKRRFIYSTSFLTYPSQIKLIKNWFLLSLPTPPPKYTSSVVFLISVHGHVLLPGDHTKNFGVNFDSLLSLIFQLQWNWNVRERKDSPFKIYQEYNYFLWSPLLPPWPGHHHLYAWITVKLELPASIFIP